MSLISLLFSLSFWGGIPILLGALAGTILTAVLIKRFLRTRRFLKENSVAIAKNKKGSVGQGLTSHIQNMGKKLFSYYGYTGRSSLGKTFKVAFETLRLYLNTSDFRYRLPFYLVMGPQGCGKHTLLDSLKIPLPVQRHPDMPDETACDFLFFDSAVVMKLSGHLVLEKNAVNSYREEWRSFLELLINFRPANPLDGIVLCISAEELLRFDAKTIHLRATYLQEKLQEAQKAWGIRLPIYFVVTQADTIEGFSAFASSIPVENRHDIFGWSSPYPLDLPYQERWIDEIFSSFVLQTLELQQEIFSSEITLSQSESLSKFPHELENLKSALEHYLSTLFQTKSFKQGSCLRGVFFTGDGLPSFSDANMPFVQQTNRTLKTLEFQKTVLPDRPQLDADGLPDALSTHPVIERSSDDHALQKKENPEAYFSTQLFKDKIFCEQGLSTPLNTAILSRVRSVRFAQIGTLLFLILGTLGLFFAHNQLSRGKNYLIPRMEEISRVMQRTLTQGHYRNLDHTFFQKQAQALLPAVSQLNTDILSSPLVIFSWVSPLQTKIEKVIGTAYQHVIFKAISQRLKENFKRLVQSPPVPHNPKYKTPDFDFFKTQSFQTLQDYIETLMLFESMLEKYNNLKNADDAEDFGFLVKKLFGYTLPNYLYSKDSGFFTTFKKSAQELQPLGLFSYEDDCAHLHNFYVKRWLKQGLDAHTIFPDLAKLRTELKRFNQQNQDYTLDDIKELNVTLGRVINFFLSKRSLWLSENTLNPGQDYQNLIKNIALSSLLPIKSAEGLTRRGNESFLRLKGVLRTYKLPVVGNMFRVLESGQLEVSPGLLRFQGFLNLLLAQPFMRQSDYIDRLKTGSSDASVFWHPHRLQNASKIIRQFIAFFQDNGRTLPIEERRFLENVCRDLLRQNVRRTIYEAQELHEMSQHLATLSPEESCRDEAENLKNALPSLSALIGLLKKHNLREVYHELRDLLHDQSVFFLEKIDAIYESEGPYEPRTDVVKTWMGHTDQILASFGVSNIQDLFNYLTLQRNRLRYLSNDFAKPAVDILKLLYVSDAIRLPNLLIKWSDILTQLNLYMKKSPSTLKMLEDFIYKTLPSLQLDGCPIVLRLAQTPTGVDYFLDTMNNIRSIFEGQCHNANEKASMLGYMQIKNFFNTYLANRYPFVPLNSQSTNDVELETLKSFFQIFDQKAPYVKDMLRQKISEKPHFRKALRFIMAMEKARPFFRLFIETMGKSTTTSLPLKLTFRTNKAQEKNLDQLIDWSLTMGNSTVSLKNPTAQTWWENDSDIKIGFRWAYGSNFRPVPKADNPALKIEGPQATLTYSGPWSLIRWIQAHRPRTKDAKAKDAKTIRLRYALPMSGQDYAYPQICLDAPLPPPEGKEIVAFMDISLMGGPENTTLAFPLSFPNFAPGIDISEKDSLPPAPVKQSRENCRIPRVPS